MAASEGLPRRRVQLDVIDRAAAGSRRRFIAFSPTEFACKFHTVVVETRTPYESRTWGESTEIVVLTD